MEALASQHTVLKSLLCGGGGGGPDEHLKPVSTAKHRAGSEDHDDLVTSGGHVVLYARRLDLCSSRKCAAG